MSPSCVIKRSRPLAMPFELTIEQRRILVFSPKWLGAFDRGRRGFVLFDVGGSTTHSRRAQRVACCYWQNSSDTLLTGRHSPTNDRSQPDLES